MEVAHIPLPFTVQLPRNAVPAVPETNSRKRKREAHIVDFTVTLPSPDETSGAGKVRRIDTHGSSRQDKENIESKLNP